MKNSSPGLIVRNNSDYTLIADLGNKSVRTISNQHAGYTWDITGELFLSATYVTIQVKGNSTQQFETFTAALGAANAQGVVDALNSLGLCQFATLTQGGITTIVTYNDTLVFGVLTIAAPTGYDIQLETFLAFAVTTYTVSANGNQIYSFTAPMGAPEVDNFDAIPGTQFALHIVTDLPPLTLQRVVVAKNTLAGFVLLIDEALPEVGTSDYSFTAETDALNYVISVTTI